MTQEEKDIDQIEKYVAGDLSAEELQQFNKKLVEEQGFAEKVKEYSLLINGIDEAGKMNFTNKLSTWEDEIQAKENSSNHKVISFKKYWLYAASFILPIIGVTLYLYFNQHVPPSDQELYSAYFSPYENILTSRSDADSDTLLAGLNAYNLGLYDVAIQNFETYVKAHPTANGTKFYLGVSYLANNQTQNAISVLSDIIDSNSTFKNTAEWYLALAYLKENQHMQAQQLLILISKNSQHEFFEKAIELLDKMEY